MTVPFNNDSPPDTHPVSEPSIRDFACDSLRCRLELVGQLLPLAAFESNQDPEHVHQLRIATRRALAALDVFGTFLPAKSQAWLRSRLKQIRSAAGEARDLDVMLSRYLDSKAAGKKHLLRCLRKRRKRAQKPLVKIHQRLMLQSSYEKRVKQCFDAIEKIPDQSVGAVAIDRIAACQHAFFRAAPRKDADVAALHRFRVKSKQLRYCLEVFTDHTPPGLSPAIFPLTKEIQTRLGNLNDHVISIGLLKQVKQKAKTKRKAKQIEKMLKKKKALVKRDHKAFVAWWKENGIDKADGCLHTAFAHAQTKATPSL